MTRLSRRDERAPVSEATLKQKRLGSDSEGILKPLGTSQSEVRSKANRKAALKATPKRLSRGVFEEPERVQREYLKSRTP